VRFIIGKDGSINDISVIRSIGGGCDEEAVRVLKSMPKWTPGRNNNRAVNVMFTLPINFRLDG
jgi:protein TonB